MSAKIVVGVDGSVHSARALAWCAAHAHAFDADVVAVHAVDMAVYLSMATPVLAAGADAGATRRARRRRRARLVQATCRRRSFLSGRPHGRRALGGHHANRCEPRTPCSWSSAAAAAAVSPSWCSAAPATSSHTIWTGPSSSCRDTRTTRDVDGDAQRARLKLRRVARVRAPPAINSIRPMIALAPPPPVRGSAPVSAAAAATVVGA